VALLFVGFWLLLFAGELVTGSYTIPFWFHGVACAVLAYALGLNTTALTPPSGGGLLKRLVRRHRADVSDAETLEET